MLCVSWLLAGVGVFMITMVQGQCCDRSHCKDFTSKDSILECIQLCRCGLQDKSSVQQATEENSSLGIILEVDSDPEPQSNERRSYSMQHFAWGKLKGRKRQPLKVYTSRLEDTKGTSHLLALIQLGRFKDMLENQEAKAEAIPRIVNRAVPQDMKNMTYVIDHFRWGLPSTNKQGRGVRRGY